MTTTRITIFLFFSMIPSYCLTNEQRFYPDVEGKQISVVQTLIENLGIELTINNIDSPSPKGSILRQIPPAKTLLGNTSRMHLTVTNGLVVPKVLNKNINIAKEELQNLGFSVEISQRTINDIPPGLIAFVSPQEGTRIDPENEALFLIVSDIKYVMIPKDIIGKQVWEVKKNSDFRFTHEVIEQPPSRPESDCISWMPESYLVTSSSPLPGQYVPLGSEVKLNHRIVAASYTINCNSEGIIE